MATIETIRDVFFRKGKSICEIARERKVDRATVETRAYPILATDHSLPHSLREF